MMAKLKTKGSQTWLVISFGHLVLAGILADMQALCMAGAMLGIAILCIVTAFILLLANNPPSEEIEP